MGIRNLSAIGVVGLLASAALVPLGTPAQTKLLGSDTVTGDKFGYSVSISGASAAVGAINHNTSQGAAYVFVKSGATWLQQAELVGGDTAKGDELGQSVAISGSELLVGAPDHSGGGAAYFFERTGTTWRQQFELLGHHIGAAVGLSGNLAVLGAVDRATSDGAAYVYTYINGNWILRATLRSRVKGDDFGVAVAVAGDEIAVGANWGGEKPGHVYVFHWTGSTAVLQAKLIPKGTTYGDLFGQSVALSGKTLVVGAPMPDDGNGAAYVYVLSGAVWKRQAKLVASDGLHGDGLGWSVGVSGNTAIAGADLHGDHGEGYVFARTGSKWAQSYELIGSNTTATDAFGAAVAQFGSVSIVGAPNKNDSRGGAYIFVE